MIEKQEDLQNLTSASDDTPEQIRVRLEKREKLLREGSNPYPVALPITSTISKVRQKYSYLQQGEETEDLVGVAGRVMFMRNSGKLCFVTLQDGEGNRLQGMISLAQVGEESLSTYKTAVDLGDHLFIHGRIISSKRGEISVLATPGTIQHPLTGSPAPAWQLACKAARPLPKVYKNAAGEEVSLSEEQRVRRRELDMIMRPAARDMVRFRSSVVRSLRHWFDENGFIEVETPMLQNVHGGAAARPFQTHINAYDADVYLRIAPELYIKRCLIGGIEKVFEINRNFRNEGADSSHSPEFTMLEAYEAYGTYDTIAALTQNIVQRSALDALGTTLVTLADGTEYDLGGDWAQIGIYESLSEKVSMEITPTTSKEDLLNLAKTHGIELEKYYSNGKIVEVIWEEIVGNYLWEPTFVRDFPVDTSPLVKAHRSQPGKVEKWDLIVRGFELATGYSELNDPVVQRNRFEQQSLEAAKGDPEAMQIDEEFLQAMEQGMPPAGGMGMGIDRLLMALTGQGIRETITFPLVKRSQ